MAKNEFDEKFGKQPKKGRQKQKTRQILKTIHNIDNELEYDEFEIQISLSQKMRR